MRENITAMYPDAIAYYRIGLGKYYYHGATRNLRKRLQHHRNELESGTHHNKTLQKQFLAWNTISVIYSIRDTIAEAKEVEQFFIDKDYADGFCCNIGTTSNKGFWGGVHGMPDWHKENISKAQTGKKHTSEFKEACRLRMLGTVMSEEQKKKRSDKLIGVKRDPVVVERIANSQRGFKRGPRDPAAVAKGLVTKVLTGSGMVQSEETRMKIAAANFKPVMAEGVEYYSTSACGEAHGIDRNTVTYRIKSDKPRWVSWDWK